MRKRVAAKKLRDAYERLAALGGTEPDAHDVPRRREKAKRRKRIT